MDELLTAQPIIEGRLFFCALSKPDGLRGSALAASSICYSIDSVLMYEPFFADFGPLNLGKTFRFCRQTKDLLQEADRNKKRLYFVCGPHPNQRANGAVLMGIFQVIYLNMSAEEAYRPLQAFKPFVPFRDASCGVSTFHLTVMDVMKGIQKARDVGFIDWNSGSSTWSLEEYEHYEQVENGDLNWIVPGKLVAFSGPANRGNEIAGYRLHTPEDYWPYYRKRGVSAIVRLNKKVYDRQRFVQGGFRHYDLYFPDGSCPSEAILLKFLEIAESEPGALAVHCKAGLGRTGVLICCYIMKHFKFTAEEVIGYIRVCRPGSVIGPQQNFLRDVEARMWHEGEMWRAARGINKPHLALEDLAISGRPMQPYLQEASLAQAAPPGLLLHNPSLGRVSAGGSLKLGYAPSWQPQASNGGLGVMASRTNSNSTASPFSSAGAAAAPTTVSAAGRPSILDPSPPSPAAADLSLLQHRQQQLASHALGSFGGGLHVHVPPSPTQPGFSACSTPSSTASTPVASNRMTGTRGMGRSITPVRYGGPSNTALGGLGPAFTGFHYAGARMGLSSAVSVTRSTPVAPLARAPSADRAFERASLRNALHHEAGRGVDRSRPTVGDLDRSAMSADLSVAYAATHGGPMAPQGPSMPIPTTPKPAPPGHRPGAGVARTLAPNGQPRKVPMAMLPQYHVGLAGKTPGAASAALLACSPSLPVTTGAAGTLTTAPGSDAGRGRARYGGK